LLNAYLFLFDILCKPDFSNIHVKKCRSLRVQMDFAFFHVIIHQTQPSLQNIGFKLPFYVCWNPVIQANLTIFCAAQRCWIWSKFQWACHLFPRLYLVVLAKRKIMKTIYENIRQIIHKTNYELVLQWQMANLLQIMVWWK
jgi:hypothetical protein